MDLLRASLLGKKSDSQPDISKTTLKKPAPLSSHPPTSPSSLSPNIRRSSFPSAISANASSVSPQKSPSTSSKSSTSTGTKSILKSTSNASNSSAKSVLLPVANNDALPTTPIELEGRLNHHTSQLQQLADRVEMINEWIGMDEIVLRRLMKDAEAAAGKERERERVTVEANRAGVPQLTFGASDNEGEVQINNAVIEMRERVKGMKRWRKEIERAVVWQRDEHWRVEKAMGRTQHEKPEFVAVNAGEEDRVKGRDGE